MKISTTPRTDAAIIEADRLGAKTMKLPREHAMYEFCRKLELECALKGSEIANLHMLLQAAGARPAGLRVQAGNSPAPWGASIPIPKGFINGNTP